MPLDLFSKTQIPNELPSEMSNTIDELKKSSNKEECLKRAYELLVVKYRGYRLKTYTRLFDIFIHDITVLWKKNGFLHCTNINFVMRTLLINSGYYKEEDLRLKWTLLYCISPHQYLQVKIDKKWVDVDIWAYVYGIKFGDHAYGFYKFLDRNK